MGLDQPDGTEGRLNYLVNLKTHRLLGNIDHARYWEGGNHVGLTVRWTPDSKACLTVYQARFGFHSVSALLINAGGTSFRQLDLGKKIWDDLNGAIRKKSNDPTIYCEATLADRINGGEILFGALVDTNPKELEDVKTYYASFRGIYDLKAEKWIEAETVSLDHDQFWNADSAQLTFAGIDETSETEAQKLDAVLNQIYQFVKNMMAADRFKEVKLQQIAWLKRRDLIEDVAERNKFVEARIAALEEMTK